MKLQIAILILVVSPFASRANAQSLKGVPTSNAATGIHDEIANLPFVAQEVTTITVSRPDGTKSIIERRADIARNSAGSTRRDVRILPRSGVDTQPTISQYVDIHDAPNHLGIRLNPAEKTAAIRPVSAWAKRHPAPIENPLGGIASPSENLGFRSIGPYTATGSRQTLRFPAGTKSPNQEVNQTTDTWYSPDLKTNLLVETADSTGSSTVTVFTITSTAEPDASLFTVPDGYTKVTVTPAVQNQSSPSLLQSADEPNKSLASKQITKQLPISHLYVHFFLYEAHLEHVADAHPNVIKGGQIKDRLRTETGLSTTDWQHVSESSLHFEKSLKEIVEQAKMLTDSDRKACRSIPQSCLPHPPNWERLVDLQSQRNQLVASECATLETELGPDSTGHLRTFLQTDTASHIQIVTVTAPLRSSLTEAK